MRYDSFSILRTTLLQKKRCPPFRFPAISSKSDLSSIPSQLAMQIERSEIEMLHDVRSFFIILTYNGLNVHPPDDGSSDRRDSTSSIHHCWKGSAANNPIQVLIASAIFSGNCMFGSCLTVFFEPQVRFSPQGW